MCYVIMKEIYLMKLPSKNEGKNDDENNANMA